MIEKRQLAAHLSELRYAVEAMSPGWRGQVTTDYQADETAVVVDSEGAPLAKMLTGGDAQLMKTAPGMLLDSPTRSNTFSRSSVTGTAAATPSSSTT